MQNSTRQRRLRANLLMLLTALIWGLAFVAQRDAMENIGPYTFNGIRFGLGALSLLPLIFYRERQGTATPHNLTIWSGGFVAGLILFGGSTFQQLGIVTTTAGKAGFITGLYMVIVPIFGIFLGRRTDRFTWAGVAFGAVGLYLLTITAGFQMAQGDFLVLISSFLWAAHILVIDHLTEAHDAIKLSIIQFATTAILSLIVGFFTETTTGDMVMQAGIPILYGGLMSVGIAYTLQVVGQKDAHPAHAGVILSLESAFAALGGWLILGEILTTRNFIGAVLMMIGMLISQAGDFFKASESDPPLQAGSAD